MGVLGRNLAPGKCLRRSKQVALPNTMPGFIELQSKHPLPVLRIGSELGIGFILQEIIQERAPIPGVGWFAAFTDTEGNRFGLMQPDDSAA